MAQWKNKRGSRRDFNPGKLVIVCFCFCFQFSTNVVKPNLYKIRGENFIFKLFKCSLNVEKMDILTIQVIGQKQKTNKQNPDGNIVTF